MGAVGELLGEGGYGCVFVPEIPCVHGMDIEYFQKRPQAGKKVSKIFTYTDDSFRKEVDAGKMISSWDPEGRYFVLPIKACKTTVKSIEKNPAAEECEGLRDIKESKKRFVNQIVMPYAGTDLFQFMKNRYFMEQQKFPVERWFQVLENILRGVAVLKKNRVCHMDIKADNVIYDGKVAKIFDFGLVRPFGEVYTRKNLDRLSNHYFVYPLEFIFVANQLKTGCGVCSLYIEYMKTIYSFEPAVRETLFQYHPKREILRTIEDMEKAGREPGAGTGGLIEEIRRQVAKADMYAVGIMCIDLERFLDFSGVSLQKQAHYRKLVQRMSAIDFRKRMGVEKALRVLDTQLAAN